MSNRANNKMSLLFLSLGLVACGGGGGGGQGDNEEFITRVTVSTTGQETNGTSSV